METEVSRRPGRPKGLAKTGGRKKGTPNKIAASVKEAILRALEKAGGEDYLVTVAQRDPKTFCALLGRILPTEVRADVGSLLTHEEALAELEARLPAQRLSRC